MAHPIIRHGNRLFGVVMRRRSTIGTCAACHATIFGDEHRVSSHGVLVHRRCAGYRRAR